MLTFKFSGADGVMTVAETLTSGMVGKQVKLEFTSDWDNLTKTAVFEAGDISEAVYNVGNTVAIPAAVLAIARRRLKIGIYGEDTEGNITPTIYAIGPRIEEGADPYRASGDPPIPKWKELEERIEDLENGTNGGGSGSDSGQNVKLPVSEDGTPDYGMAGYYAVSDGQGGITWVTGGNSGGDTPVVPGSHGVVWNLVNVTSSASVVSVSDGAALVATLTPADGYILGDVTVTMGGEALTGVWNAETATITIASVTGDVVISCAGVEQTEESEALTIAQGTAVTDYATFATAGQQNMGVAGPSTLKANKIRFQWNAEESNGFQIMIFQYDADGNPHKISAVQSYSADPTTDGAAIATWVDAGGSAKYTAIGGGDIIVELPTAGSVMVMLRRSSASGTAVSDNATFWTWALSGLTITAVYSNATTKTASVAEQVDSDYAMDYGIATTALVTDSVADSKSGIDAAYGAVVEEAKNTWLLECNGNMDKIPLIIHTDQHGTYNTALFDFLSEILNWYDVGKVINLGDTVSFWNDSDAEHKWNSCGELENYLESMKNVPFSKRIEIFGNHDTWNSSYETAGNQAHLHKYFRNIYARRADNYGNFVVKDDNYNVKYVVVSGFAYDSTLGGHTHYVMHPDSIRWAIAEMEKADGYDIILLSHCPLNSINYKDMPELWSGRKAKTSGTTTDEYGKTYSFDFTGCDGELLCALHGHNHEDGHAYIGELLDVWLDGVVSDNDPIHFVIVDRANRQLNVWKVDNTPQYSNYQIPFVQHETTE